MLPAYGVGRRPYLRLNNGITVVFLVLKFGFGSLIVFPLYCIWISIAVHKLSRLKYSSFHIM